MKNVSGHTDLCGELLTSLLMRGIQMGEISKLDWLMGLVKHVLWAKTLCLCFLEYKAMDEVRKPTNSEHHHLYILNKLRVLLFLLYQLLNHLKN
jgi:hypothetical protein